jgi:hypothetical protein
VIAEGPTLRKQKDGAPENSKPWTNAPENTVTSSSRVGSCISLESIITVYPGKG